MLTSGSCADWFPKETVRWVDANGQTVMAKQGTPFSCKCMGSSMGTARYEALGTPGDESMAVTRWIRFVTQFCHLVFEKSLAFTARSTGI